MNTHVYENKPTLKEVVGSKCLMMSSLSYVFQKVVHLFIYYLYYINNYVYIIIIYIIYIQIPALHS